MLEISSASQSSMVKECDTTRVPGRMARSCGRSFMLRPGSRYMVMTVACEKSVAKMSAWRMTALPAPTPATPAACARSFAYFAMSALYSMPVALAPRFAAAMAILPSPAPRSKWMSFGPSCTMVSMRSTTSSGVGTQMTSLPAWPTCGSYFWESAFPENKNNTEATTATARIMKGPGEGRRGKGQRNLPHSPPYLLEHFRSVVREPRALAAGERHMTGVAPVLHPVDHVSEAGAALGEIRRIDLCNISEAHHLGARSGARHQRLHLLRRQVLRLVDDQPLVDEGAAAHEVERLDLHA